MMQIRKAEITDLEAVTLVTAGTIREIYPHYYPAGAVAFFLDHHEEAHIRRDIEAGLVFLCLDAQRHAVGTVTVRQNEICRLFVLPRYQGRGYGRALLDYAEKYVSETHAEIVLDASLPAKPIYLKRGYRIVDSKEIPTEYGDFLCYDVMKKGTAV